MVYSLNLKKSRILKNYGISYIFMKKINVKLTLPEIQAIAIATTEHWIKIKDEPCPKGLNGQLLTNYPKNWKKLSEYLFAIYRININK